MNNAWWYIVTLLHHAFRWITISCIFLIDEKWYSLFDYHKYISYIINYVCNLPNDALWWFYGTFLHDEFLDGFHGEFQNDSALLICHWSKRRNYDSVIEHSGWNWKLLFLRKFTQNQSCQIMSHRRWVTVTVSFISVDWWVWGTMEDSWAFVLGRRPWPCTLLSLLYPVYRYIILLWIYHCLTVVWILVVVYNFMNHG